MYHCPPNKCYPQRCLVFTCPFRGYTRFKRSRIYLPTITYVKFVAPVKFHYRVRNAVFSGYLAPLA